MPHSSDYDRLMVEPEDKGGVIKKKGFEGPRKDSEDRGGGKKWVPSRSHPLSLKKGAVVNLFTMATVGLVPQMATISYYRSSRDAVWQTKTFQNNGLNPPVLARLNLPSCFNVTSHLTVFHHFKA